MDEAQQINKPRHFGRVVMKRLADGEEAADFVPLIVVPVEVEVTLRPVPVEVGHVAVTISVDPRRAVIKCGTSHPFHCLLIARHGCILSEDVIPLAYSTKYFHKEHSDSTVRKAVTLHILTYRSVQISIAQSRNRGLKHLLSK